MLQNCSCDFETCDFLPENRRKDTLALHNLVLKKTNDPICHVSENKGEYDVQAIFLTLIYHPGCSIALFCENDDVEYYYKQMFRRMMQILKKGTPDCVQYVNEYTMNCNQLTIIPFACELHYLKLHEIQRRMKKLIVLREFYLLTLDPISNYFRNCYKSIPREHLLRKDRHGCDLSRDWNAWFYPSSKILVRQ